MEIYNNDIIKTTTKKTTEMGKDKIKYNYNIYEIKKNMSK